MPFKRGKEREDSSTSNGDHHQLNVLGKGVRRGKRTWVHKKRLGRTTINKGALHGSLRVERGAIGTMFAGLGTSGG